MLAKLIETLDPSGPVWFYICMILIIRIFLSEIRTVWQIAKQYITQPVNLSKSYGSWALVTGATDGIGKAYCHQLASRRINLIIVGRNNEKLQKVKSELENQHKIEVKTLLADFSEGEKIYDGLKRELENVDVGILVNNVGIQYQAPAPFSQLPIPEIWDNLMVNLASALMMTKLVLPQMMARRKGAIVNISSGSYMQPHPYMNLYAASKAYLYHFSEALREECKPGNITVQTVTPFYVSSKINHFASSLTETGFLIPDTTTYVKSLITSLGKIDTTTGYWPHRLQWLGMQFAPAWVRTKIIHGMYERFSREYHNSLRRD